MRAVLADGAEGWGECSALREPTYSAETSDGALEVVRRHLGPLVLSGEPLDAVRGHPMAKAAVELALLDATLRRGGTNLAAHIGATATEVPCGAAVGLPPAGAPDPQAWLLSEVGPLLAAGYRRIKLKVQPGWDLQPAAAVRAAWPDLALQVDANGSYAALGVERAAAALGALDALGLLLVEQPLADDDLVGHAALAERIATPVCLDEAVVSLASLDAALALHACTVVNLKVGRVGGVAEALRIHDRCRAAGVGLWVGGMYDLGIGRAVLAAFAALPGCTHVGDTSGSARWFPEDVTEPLVPTAEGMLPVPSGPGIGVTPIPDVLARLTVAVETLRR